MAGDGVDVSSHGCAPLCVGRSFATMHQWFTVLILLMPLMCFRDYLLSQIVFKCSFPDKVFDRLCVLKLEVFAYHKSAAAI